MSDYQTIIAATDLHHDCFPVCEAAIKMAKHDKAKLYVTAVIPEVPYYMASGLSSLSNVETQLEEQIQERFAIAKQKLGFDADLHIKHGSAKKEILKFAKRLNADLIVIGSHGKHGVQLVLGSTSSHVLHRAGCDVLVVRTTP